MRTIDEKNNKIIDTFDMKLIDTEEMIYMIEDLLSISHKSYQITDELIIQFKGNKYKVQQDVLKWLSSPDRVSNMKAMLKEPL